MAENKSENIVSYATMPSEYMPAYFVDIVTNCSSTREVTKLTFARTVFDIINPEILSNQPNVQLAMSNATFLNMYAFAHKNIRNMIKTGVYTEEEVESIIREVSAD